MLFRSAVTAVLGQGFGEVVEQDFAAAGGGFSAPSHSATAVAGVQELLRQQYSLVPFFQTMPLALVQLSIRCGAVVAAGALAPWVAQPPSAATAINVARVFNSVMVFFSREGAIKSISTYGKFKGYRVFSARQTVVGDCAIGHSRSYSPPWRPRGAWMPVSLMQHGAAPTIDAPA